MATILIVEDEFAIVEMLKQLFSDQDHNVLTALNGSQGLERLAEGPHPDLVICNFMMPIMDGGRMLRAMRENKAYRDVPFIMISALPESNISEEVKGYSAFLRKPFSLAGLLDLVASVLSSARPTRWGATRRGGA